ncbi:sugar-binding transcriptional regulator [Aureimonas glaciei]|uniref:Sugar-binding protein n=1 Tax=Aureimonas glaciei TaxID=1776957 RepID=A0A916XUH8_9HYPH|nr:sugar-binding domain-containing protein [Aureimonas glaciei]GGD10212.1 sugar-binding protein [Aureimonas glaciei]
MSQEDLLARVAHLYYVLGETQQVIAQRLGMTRIRVHRLLAEAREQGVVQVQIRSQTGATLDLEHRLAERFALAACRVTPSDESPDHSLSQIVGSYAAPFVAPMLQPPLTVAMAWGVTLQSLAGAIEPVGSTGEDTVTVVPLLGSLSRRSSIDRYEAGTLLAQRLHAECYYLPGPIFTDTKASREAILQQPLAQEVIALALCADLALASVGGTDCGTLRSVGYFSDAVFAEVLALGAIGNFLGYFMDAQGRIVDHPANECVVGVHPFDLGGVPCRVLVSGGTSKAPMMRMLLERGTFTHLVTDAATGRALLQEG